MTRTQNTSRRGVLIATLAFSLLAGACGSDDNTAGQPDAQGATSSPGEAAVECASGTISGAGSTFVHTIVQQWIKDFGAACPGATVNYQAVGSGAGIQQLTAGTVDFAGSDVAMKADEQAAAEAKAGPVLHIPWSAGAIAVEYNLPGVDGLKLTPEAIAGIFAGTIKRWDAPAVAGANAGVKLPATAVQVIHRSDGSGTTAAFTGYLAATAPDTWTVGSGKDVAWPTGQGAKGSDGVTAAVKQAEGAIGYAEVSFAKGAALGIARVQNAGGAFVAPTSAAVSAALEAAEVPDDLKVKVSPTPNAPAAYPISTTTFVLVPRRPSDPGKAKLLKAFVTYALGRGQAVAEQLFYAPLPTSLEDKANASAEAIGS